VSESHVSGNEPSTDWTGLPRLRNGTIAGGANRHAVSPFVTDETAMPMMSDGGGTNADVNAIAGMDFERAWDSSND
jgi:hypothetical protein